MNSNYTTKATELFVQFHTETIDLPTFYNELKKVAVEMVASEHETTKNYYMNDIFEAQFNEYKKDPINNGYLLSIGSSGSLLRTFDQPE